MPGDHPSRAGVPVTYHQAHSAGIEQISVHFELSAPLGQQRHSENVFGGQATQLVQADRQLPGIISHLRGGVMN
jgi:hypothetical protein